MKDVKTFQKRTLFHRSNSIDFNPHIKTDKTTTHMPKKKKKPIDNIYNKVFSLIILALVVLVLLF